MAKEMTSSLANHDRYVELCALASSTFAISRRLSHAEWNDLIGHLSGCAECRELMRDFMQVSFHLKPEPIASDSAFGTAPNGASQRLIVRPAVLDSPPGQDSLVGPKPVARRMSRLAKVAICTAIAASLAFAFALGAKLGIAPKNTLNSSRTQPDDSNHRVGSSATDPTARLLLADNERLTTQLQAAEKQEAVLVLKVQDNTDALAAAQHRDAELNARIVVLENANTRLSEMDSGRNSELAQLRQDLERLRSESEANHNAATLARIELADRSAEVKRVSAQLSDARRFIATLSEAQDLIEGRGVHVWTVYYADENGKRQQAYGRILYEDGKKLVFYAYDLAGRNSVDTRLSFYVWGEKSGTHLPVKNLGILHIDDSQKGRWKLTFDDPNVLAQINGVFVTAEASNTVGTGPSGRRMLSARLETTTDHP